MEGSAPAPLALALLLACHHPSATHWARAGHVLNSWPMQEEMIIAKHGELGNRWAQVGRDPAAVPAGGGVATPALGACPGQVPGCRDWARPDQGCLAAPCWLFPSATVQQPPLLPMRHPIAPAPTLLIVIKPRPQPLALPLTAAQYPATQLLPGHTGNAITSTGPAHQHLKTPRPVPSVLFLLDRQVPARPGRCSREPAVLLAPHPGSLISLSFTPCLRLQSSCPAGQTMPLRTTGTATSRSGWAQRPTRCAGREQTSRLAKACA